MVLFILNTAITLNDLKIYKTHYFIVYSYYYFLNYIFKLDDLVSVSGA